MAKNYYAVYMIENQIVKETFNRWISKDGWPGCKERIDGHKFVVFKGFDTMPEVTRFFQEEDQKRGLVNIPPSIPVAVAIPESPMNQPIKNNGIEISGDGETCMLSFEIPRSLMIDFAKCLEDQGLKGQGSSIIRNLINEWTSDQLNQHSPITKSPFLEDIFSGGSVSTVNTENLKIAKKRDPKANFSLSMDPFNNEVIMPPNQQMNQVPVYNEEEDEGLPWEIF